MGIWLNQNFFDLTFLTKNADPMLSTFGTEEFLRKEILKKNLYRGTLECGIAQLYLFSFLRR